MGSAAQSSSAADSAGYEDAKEAMRAAVESGLNDRAVDIAVTAALATQPNGPAKIAIYTYSKYTATFVAESNKNGVEEGAKAVGREVVKDELARAGAEHVVEHAQDAVVTASQNEMVRRGTGEVNKNFVEQSEQAATETLSAIMSNGADALSERKADNER